MKQFNDFVPAPFPDVKASGEPQLAFEPHKCVLPCLLCFKMSQDRQGKRIIRCFQHFTLLPVIGQLDHWKTNACFRTPKSVAEAVRSPFGALVRQHRQACHRLLETIITPIVVNKLTLPTLNMYLMMIGKYSVIRSLSFSSFSRDRISGSL